MRRILIKKLRESLFSVLPVAAIVLLLAATPLLSLSASELVLFLFCAFFLILGIGLFNLGADLAMTPMGEHVGSGLTKSKSLLLLLSVSFLMGVLITVAEPDLSVLAEQAKDVLGKTSLIVAVGVGVGLFLLLAVIKILFRTPLSSLLFCFYMLLFAVTALVILNGNEALLPLAYDSGGVTTGPITVPFIMALGVGIATTVGGKHAEENSFGLIALCSVGPMLAVLFLAVFAKNGLAYETPDYANAVFSWSALLHTVGDIILEVFLALGLIALFFAILQAVYLKLPKKRILQITVGILYTFFGLVIFLTSVTVGFMPIGYRLGLQLATNAPAPLLIGFGLLLGAVVVLAEPAVHVLNRQVEDLTDGTVSRTSMMIALSVGVGASIALSFLRIVFDFNLLYYLIPGYFISLGLSFFVPRLYTAIAFDSGGVASGPLTSGFILPMAIGVCTALQGTDHVLSDAFGIVAMVAMAPLITIQVLGFRAVMARKVQKRIAMKRILGAEDEQIISFL